MRFGGETVLIILVTLFPSGSLAQAPGELAWEVSEGGRHSPAIGENGTAYIGDDRLVALDRNGGQQWAFDLDVTAAPTLDAEGRVFVGAADGKLYAVSASSGEKLWEFDTEGGSVKSSPAVGANGILYFGAASGKVYAVEGSTGEEQWSFQTGSRITSSAAITSRGRLYIGSKDGKLYALDSANGKLEGTFATGHPVQSNPAVGADGTIYLVSSEAHQLFALDPNSMDERWAASIDDDVPANEIGLTPVIGTEGDLYINAGAHVYRFNGATGSIKDKGGGRLTLASNPVIGTENRVYFGGGYPDMAEKSGEFGEWGGWTTKIFGVFWGTPNIDQRGTVYVGYLGELGLGGGTRAFFTSGEGLAASAWPSFQRDQMNRGRAPPSSMPAEDWVPLGETLSDWPGDWETEGDAYWFGQTTVTDASEAAAQSGSIGDGEESSLVTSVATPGVLTFSWKVSSEEGDSLSFWLGDAKKASIEEETDWTEVGLEIPSGQKEIRWTYAKDAAGTAGEDAGWVDDIRLERSEKSFPLKWRSDSLGESVSIPALGQDGTIYVTAHTDTVFALDSSTGKEIWRFEVEPINSRLESGSFTVAPTIGSDGTVYVVTEGRQDLLGAPDDRIFGLDGRTGVVVWSTDTLTPLGSPALGPTGTLYLPAASSVETGLEAFRGKAQSVTGGRSFVNSGSLFDTQPTVPAVDANGVVYAGTLEGSVDPGAQQPGPPPVFAADSQTGEMLWTYRTEDPARSPPALGKDGTVYIGTKGGQVLALAPGTGKLKWSYAVSGGILGSPVLSKGSVVVPATRGSLYALDAQTGELLWVFSADSPLMTTPAIGANGMVYFAANNGKVLAVDEETGVMTRVFQTAGSATSAVSLGEDGTLYIGADDGRLYALGTESEGLMGSAWPKFQRDAGNTGQAPPFSAFSELNISALDEGVEIKFDDSGILQTAPTVTGPWSPAEKSSPATFPLNGSAQFFRVKREE